MGSRLAKIIPVLLLCALMQACGQKGSLYLPGEEQAAVYPVPFAVTLQRA